MLLGYWTATFAGLKTNPYLSTCTKIKAQRTKDINVRPENVKLLEKNRENIS
jgi:hypothetical protein